MTSVPKTSTANRVLSCKQDDFYYMETMLLQQMGNDVGEANAATLEGERNSEGIEIVRLPLIAAHEVLLW